MGMYDRKEFTRRHFLAGSGIVAAAAAGGFAGYVIAQVDGRGAEAPQSHAATPGPVGGLLPGPRPSGQITSPGTPPCPRCNRRPYG